MHVQAVGDTHRFVPELRLVAAAGSPPPYLAVRPSRQDFAKAPKSADEEERALRTRGIVRPFAVGDVGEGAAREDEEEARRMARATGRVEIMTTAD